MRLLTGFALVSTLLLAGCDSFPDRINSRLEEVPPQVHEFEGTVEQIYFAAQKAFKRLDFNLTRSSMGRVEAASSIHTSTAFGDSRQLVARIAIHESGPGKCEVEMWLTEDVSSQSMGGTHRTPAEGEWIFRDLFC